MIRIAALNDESAGTVTRDAFSEVTTKEAQEEAAFALYNKALQLQNDEFLDEAESVFKQLLSIDILRDVGFEDDRGVKSGGGVRTTKATKAASSSSSQSLLLKYSTYKNLANIASKKGEYEAAMESYLEATCLDPTDVTVWFRSGMTALKIRNYPLAKVAFLEGLKCNSGHWPCLDNVVTVLYALNNYYSCLYYIGLALEKDAFYLKGLAIRDKIYEEQPGLRKDSEDFFTNCDEAIHTNRYDKAEGQKFIDEALEMRRIKRERSRSEQPPLLNFTKPLTSMTWKNLGESLVDLYDVISKAKKPISFSCRVNIARCIEKLSTRSSPGVNSTSGSSSMNDDQSGMSVIPIVVITSPSRTEVTDVVVEQPATIANQNATDASVNLEADDGHSLSQSETPVLLDSTSAASRRRRKRKAFFFECIDAASKRRSARVRNTATKKQPEYVNYSKLLHTFLPSSLISNGDEEKEMSAENEKADGDLSTSDDGQVDDSDSKVSMNIELEESESVEVPKFLESVRSNTGVLNIMYKFLLHLGTKHSMVWPAGLSDVYVEAYGRLRKHIVHPSPFSLDYDEDDITNEGFMTLLYCEFTVDKWIGSKARSQNSSSSSPSLPLRTPSPLSPSGTEFASPYIAEDTDFLAQLTVGSGIFESYALEFTTRVFFMKARTLMLQNQLDFAASCFGRIVTLLNDATNGSGNAPKIMLINCKVDNVITLEQIQKQLESLLQCQSLEELHRLHQAGKDQQVVDLLMPTFAQSSTTSKVSNRGTIPDRHSQLLVLQDALWNLGDQKQCIYGGEASFHEALHRYSLMSTADPLRSVWASTVNQLLSKVERCITQTPAVVHKLPLMNLKRFISNLIRVIVIQMEFSESVAESPIRTVLPWILLYYCIRQEEEKIRLLMVKSVCAEDGQSPTVSKSEENRNEVFGDADFGPGMPSSLMLLYNAHEHLGRRGWCCQSDGALLLIYADILVQQLRKSTPSSPHPFKEDLEVNAEQCFFCLYGHPNRKKAKHLQEHGATQISLSWIRAKPLFEYFKPKQLPEFDSYKVSTISNEVEYLLRRILTLVPSDEDPASRVDFMCAYIEGSVEEIPTFEKDLSAKPITSELYYLLADYHFKNKELGKAIKFYLLDVCVDPKRFNSWAGMALARSSQLEQKLNSCELRSEGPIYRKATAAFRCFERALRLDPSVTSLWIENGSLAYMLHSYTCRQLKQRVQFELPAEVVQLLREKRSELLKLAQKCFTSANQCKEGTEEWLHHYMLGKIAEKMDKPPQEYLAHYKMAALHLHLEEASYPNRIQYHSPPHLSMEALEVYYRTHASVLKYLLRNEGKPLNKEIHEQVEKFLNDVSEEPFAKFKEKRHTSSDVEDGNSVLAAQRKILRTVRSLANDHDYFRRKRKNSSSDETNAEPRHNPSADSSSESQDSATVKDLLNSIVSVISERHHKHDTSGNKSTIVVGDAKIYRPQSKAQSLKKERTPVVQNKIEQSKRSVMPEVSSDLGKQSSESEIEITELVVSKDVIVTRLKVEASKPSIPTVNDHSLLAVRCVDALKHCLQRFSQHYKSVYRLAHYYSKSKYHKNVQRSHDYLVGPKIQWQQCPHMTTQALFAERKNLNFFNGIWRIPVDEIDRPGSFASHMFRSILLLISILEEARGHHLMVQITVQLHRNPDTGKKYLRDADRMYLANLSYERSIRILLRKMKSLCKEDTDPLVQPSAVRHMMDTYQAWQKLQKVVSNPDNINSLLERVYFIFRKGKIDDYLPCFDQAIRFCQHQQFLEKIPQMAAASLSYVGSINPQITSSETFAANSGTSSTLKSHNQSMSTGGLYHVNEDFASSNIPYKISASETTSHFLSGGHVLSSPNLLTADVQSKIKSLDPVEPFRMQASKQMSGFQLEFLRQINASMCSQSGSSSKAEVVSHRTSSYSTLLKDFEVTLNPVSDPKESSETSKPFCIQLESSSKESESQEQLNT